MNVGTNSINQQIAANQGLNSAHDFARGCPYPAGTASAIVWHRLQDAKDHLEQINLMISNYAHEAKAHQSIIQGLEQALAKLTSPPAQG